LLPIAAGHEGSVAAILLAAALARPFLDQRGLRFAAAGALVGFAILLLLRRRLHPYLGMRLSLVGLAAWSFLMSSAHGAGLMAVPLYLGLQVPAPGQLQVPAGILQALAAASSSSRDAGTSVSTGVTTLAALRTPRVATLGRPIRISSLSSPGAIE